MLRRLVIAACLAGCGPREPTVSIEPLVGIRDLVATVDVRRAELLWEGPDGQRFDGARVPARELWPGDRWEVTATMRSGATDRASIVVPEPPGGNVLVVLLDDVGVDKVSAYGDPTSPQTPTLDALASEGMRFTRAYANPVCTPSRAALLTGRHAGRSGMGWIADTGDRDQALPLEAWLLPEALADARTTDPWADSTVGKWHLAGPRHSDVLTHANDSGVSWFGGLVGNPRYPEGWGYDRWEYLENGQLTVREGYLTSATIDDALERMRVMPEPWFLYLPLNAPHTPWTPPPDELLPEPLPASPTDVESYQAVLQAMDHEIGRMLDTMDSDLRARTTIIVVGDNGTPSHAVDERYDPERQKHTLFEGGINVPLIVTGPHVQHPGSSTDALAHLTDVFPTIAELAGVPLEGPDEELTVIAPDGPRPLDGRSWVPLFADPTLPGPEFMYSEAFSPNGSGSRSNIDRRMVRDDHYKLMRTGDVLRLFPLDTGGTGLDGPDLLERGLDAEARDAFDRLSDALDAYEQEIEYVGY